MHGREYRKLFPVRRRRSLVPQQLAHCGLDPFDVLEPRTRSAFADHRRCRTAEQTSAYMMSERGDCPILERDLHFDAIAAKGIIEERAGVGSGKRTVAERVVRQRFDRFVIDPARARQAKVPPFL